LLRALPKASPNVAIVMVSLRSRVSVVMLEEQLRLVPDLADQFGLGKFVILRVTCETLKAGRLIGGLL